MRIRRGSRVAAGLIVCSAIGVQAEDRPWVEVRSPRFTVVSQSGEGAARDLAWQFEQVHAVFSRAYPWAKLESGRPFVVLAVRNEAALRELSPAFWGRWKMRPGAAFVSDSGQDFVAIRTDLGGGDDAAENPYRTAYEGYVSIVLGASFPGRLPLWFQKGMQSFFGNTLVRQKDVHVGRPIKRDLELLNSGSRYSLAELMAIERDSPSFRKEADREVFEAQAWLFLHYLFFGEEGAHLPKVNRYADLLRAGRPGPDAFREAFGDPAALESGLNLYLSRKLYRYTRLNLDVNVDRAAFRSRPVPAPEAFAIRAAFQRAIDEPVAAARGLAESALKADPKQPVAHEVLAQIAEEEKRTDDARAAYALAVENGSQSYWAHYRLAQLLWKQDADRATLERIARALERSAKLNPDHAWSLSYLADTRVRLDDAASALEPARKAVQLAPGEPYHRRTLARTLAHLNQPDAAQAEAGRALALSKEEQEKTQSRDVLVWLTRRREAAAAGANATATIVPAGANPGAGGNAAARTDETGEAGESDTDESRTVLLDKHPCEVSERNVCLAWLAAAEKACADGSLEACSSAGWAYSAAPGVTRDPAKAARMLEKACQGGHQDGCVNLAVNLVNRGTAEDRTRALDLLSKSCAAGNASACSVRATIRAR